MSLAQTIFLVAVGAFTLTAAVMDTWTRRLPNWLTVPTFFVAILYHLIANGLGGLGTAFGGFAVGFGILFVLWLTGGGGGGDVKLMGALGAWLGAATTFYVFVVSAVLAICGGVLVLIGTTLSGGIGEMKRRFLRPTPVKDRRDRPLSEDELTNRRVQRRLIPFGLPVAVGTWLVLAWQAFRPS